MKTCIKFISAAFIAAAIVFIAVALPGEVKAEEPDIVGAPQTSVVTVSITLNAKGGLVNGKKTDKVLTSYGEKIGTLPTPTLTGYKFTGWYTAKSGGTKITGSAVIQSKRNLTLYAHWSKKFTVTLNAKGGFINKKGTATINVTYGEKIGKLPTPTLNGYKFLGWYTKKEGGKKVDASTIYASSFARTYYAHWKGLTPVGEIKTIGNIKMFVPDGYEVMDMSSEDTNTFYLFPNGEMDFSNYYMILATDKTDAQASISMTRYFNEEMGLKITDIAKFKCGSSSWSGLRYTYDGAVFSAVIATKGERGIVVNACGKTVTTPEVKKILSTIQFIK